MKIFITRELPEEILEQFTAAGHEVDQWMEKRNPDPEELIRRCRGCEALLCIGPNKLDRPFFAAMDKLKVVALYRVGYDNVDLQAATDYNIPVGNTPDVLTAATAGIAFLLMQNVARKAFHHHKQILLGNWGFFEPFKDTGIALEGKTLGIFGLGRIGYEMAKKARGAFDMKILYHNRSSNAIAETELGATKVSFDELLAKSDVISVHANLSNETNGIFNELAFAKMKKTAIFINTARGDIHNEEHLKAALDGGSLWGAGLDVTNPEPMKKDNPLLDMPNTAILPHIGSSTIETRMKMMQLSIDTVLHGLKCEKLPTIVNAEVYTKA